MKSKKKLYELYEMKKFGKREKVISRLVSDPSVYGISNLSLFKIEKQHSNEEFFCKVRRCNITKICTETSTCKLTLHSQLNFN